MSSAFNQSVIASASKFNVIEYSGDKIFDVVHFESSSQKTPLLITTENEGVLIHNEALTPYKHFESDGLYTKISDVQFENQYHFIGSYSHKYQKLRVLWQPISDDVLRTDQYQVLHEVPLVNLSVKNLCFFSNPYNQSLSMYVLDGFGKAHQWLLYSTQKEIKKPVLLRSVHVPIETVACAVDHQRAWMYVAEENVGVWRYMAHEETDGERQLVVANTPIGQLKGDIKDLQVTSDGSVWLLIEDDSSEILQYHLSEESFDSLLARQNNIFLPLEETDFFDISSFNESSFGMKSKDKTSQETEMLFTFVVHDEDKSQLLYFQHKGIMQPSLPFAKDIYPTIEANVETVPSDLSGDVMDDPAIWYNSSSPADSLVLGTNKKSGLHVYDLGGKQKQFLEEGRLNNVDIRYGFPFKGDIIDIAVATRRNDNSLILFGITQQGHVFKMLHHKTTLNRIYGICLGALSKSEKDRHFFIYVNDKDGRVIQYEIIPHNQSNPEVKEVRHFKLNSQPEGCVVHDTSQQLFIGEEEHGIWVTSALASEKPALTEVIKVGKHLTADVEGLSIATGKNGVPWLVASSQGNDSYSIFNALPPHQFIGRFRIDLNLELGIDGVSETDGLDVYSQSFGKTFPLGLLVVQDGRNIMPNQGQNFKLIDWGQVLQLFD